MGICRALRTAQRVFVNGSPVLVPGVNTHQRTLGSPSQGPFRKSEDQPALAVLRRPWGDVSPGGHPLPPPRHMGEGSPWASLPLPDTAHHVFCKPAPSLLPSLVPFGSGPASGPEAGRPQSSVCGEGGPASVLPSGSPQLWNFHEALKRFSFAFVIPLCSDLQV